MLPYPDSHFLHKLADAADAQTLPRFKTSLRIDCKSSLMGSFDPVTEADRAAETAMRSIITRYFPEHSILGEEFGETGKGDGQWVLDPIDGTRAFLCGMPMWGTLIGFMEQGRAVSGMLSQPFTGERFWADELGAWSGAATNPTPLATSGISDLSKAVLHTTSPEYFDDTSRDGFTRLSNSVRMTRYGGECYAAAMVAAGHIHLNFEPVLESHDVVALIPIIERAGGVITRLDGGRPEDGGAILASANEALHYEALELLNL